MNSLTPAIVTAAVPSLLIIAALLLNFTGLRDLRTELTTQIGELRREMNARFDAVDAELRYFHGQTGSLSGRI